MNNFINIPSEHLEIVLDILRRHLTSEMKVYVFGSRAKGRHRKASDLDLALEGNGKIDRKVIGRLEDEFEDSLLPYKVDILDLNTIDTKFKSCIEKEMIALKVFTNLRISDDNKVLFS